MSLAMSSDLLPTQGFLRQRTKGLISAALTPRVDLEVRNPRDRRRQGAAQLPRFRRNQA